MEKVYVPKSPHEKAMQRALIQYRNPQNYDLVKEALLKAGREDLIGFGTKCLIPPRKEKWREKQGETKNQRQSEQNKSKQKSQKNFPQNTKNLKKTKKSKKRLAKSSQRR